MFLICDILSTLATTSKVTSEKDRAEKRDNTNEKEIVKNNEKNRKEVKLASVKNLRKVVEDTNHPELRDIVANHTFVGKVALNSLGFKIFPFNIPYTRNYNPRFVYFLPTF